MGRSETYPTGYQTDNQEDAKGGQVEHAQNKDQEANGGCSGDKGKGVCLRAVEGESEAPKEQQASGFADRDGERGTDKDGNGALQPSPV